MLKNHQGMPAHYFSIKTLAVDRVVSKQAVPHLKYGVYEA